MIDLPIGQHDGGNAGSAQRTRPLKLRGGANLRVNVGRSVAQYPSRAIDAYRDRGLGARARPKAAGADGGTVAAVAIPLREAAARSGAENPDAHESGAAPVSAARRREDRLPRGDVHRDFEAPADDFKRRFGPLHCNLLELYAAAPRSAVRQMPAVSQHFHYPGLLARVL